MWSLPALPEIGEEGARDDERRAGEEGGRREGGDPVGPGGLGRVERPVDEHDQARRGDPADEARRAGQHEPGAGAPREGAPQRGPWRGPGLREGERRRHHCARPACAIATTTLRGPLKGVRAWAVSMLSSITTSPDCQGKTTVCAASTARIASRSASGIGLPSP